jgi:hypothetical protein
VRPAARRGYRLSGTGGGDARRAGLPAERAPTRRPATPRRRAASWGHPMGAPKGPRSRASRVSRRRIPSPSSPHHRPVTWGTGRCASLGTRRTRRNVAPTVSVMRIP